MNSANLQISAPFVLVIFGATGDLTQRKLLPALFHLFLRRLLPEHFYIVGFSRRQYSTDDFKAFCKDALKKYDTRHAFDAKMWESFSGKLYYQQGEFGEKEGYLALISKLKEIDVFTNACVPRYFYLATPPDKYGGILEYLHKTKLSEGCGQGSDKWTKVLIEKPFGRSLEDAKALDSRLATLFKEDQIYRIDHYLGKETVQNILAFRYSNTLFDTLWNRQFIDHVQITIAENLGVETRGNFYEGVGALRDMAQSHLLELMAAVAMKPQVYDGEGIRDARARMIQSINCIEPEEVGEKVVRGQYGASSVERLASRSQKVNGYREETNVDSKSNTETFVALKLTLSDPRWEGVQFYMRTGKRLKQKVTEVSVVLKEPGHTLFKKPLPFVPDVLTFRIEPDEAILLGLNARKGGFTNDFDRMMLSYIYHKNRELTDPYERLLLDAMKGDQTLFTRTDEVAAEWTFIEKISQGWKKTGKPEFPNYKAGSWGPEEANTLIERDGRKWLLK